jgi:hypothetical protein
MKIPYNSVMNFFALQIAIRHQYTQNNIFTSRFMGVKMVFYVEGETRFGSFREYFA